MKIHKPVGGASVLLTQDEDSPAIVGVESCHRRTTGDRQDLWRPGGLCQEGAVLCLPTEASEI